MSKAMTQVHMSIDELYDRLAQKGLTEDYIRTYALPDWWDPEIEHELDGVIKDTQDYLRLVILG